MGGGKRKNEIWGCGEGYITCNVKASSFDRKHIHSLSLPLRSMHIMNFPYIMQAMDSLDPGGEAGLVRAVYLGNIAFSLLE